MCQSKPSIKKSETYQTLHIRIKVWKRICDWLLDWKDYQKSAACEIRRNLEDVGMFVLLRVCLAHHILPEG